MRMKRNNKGCVNMIPMELHNSIVKHLKEKHDNEIYKKDIKLNKILDNLERIRESESIKEIFWIVDEILEHARGE
jgi:hypothetical protein